MFDDVKWRQFLMMFWLTTKSTRVPQRVCRVVMHTHQCIHLCQSSFMPNGVLLGTSTSARGRVLGSLAFCVVCSCTWASTCMEPALVNLCSQWSPVVHMHVDPSCLLQHHSMFEHSFWVACPPYPSFFSTVYATSVWRVPFFPSAWVLMARLPGFASHGSCQ